MLVIKSKDDLSYPHMTCDICGEILKDAGTSALVFDSFAKDGTVQNVFAVHKGNIDGYNCHDIAEARVAAAGGTAGWHEMRTYLSDMCENLNYKSEEMTKHRKMIYGE